MLNINELYINPTQFAAPFGTLFKGLSVLNNGVKIKSLTRLKGSLAMEDTFHHLKTKLYALVQLCQSLKEANLQLKQITFQLSREKDILQARHKDAIAQIENMVSRLKLLEKPQ